MASDIGKIETKAQFSAMKDVLMLCNQNKPFHSSMSTRNRLVSSTGKVETWARLLGMRQRSWLLPSFCYYTRKGIKRYFYCNEWINRPHASCPSVVCLKTPASSKPRSKISPTF